MKCPRCDSRNISKNGRKNGKQRYVCEDCRRQFVLNPSAQGYPEAFKQICLKEYAEGASFRAIEKRHKVHHTTVVLWAKQAGLSVSAGALAKTKSFGGSDSDRQAEAIQSANPVLGGDRSDSLVTVTESNESRSFSSPNSAPVVFGPISVRAEKAEAILAGALQVFTADGYTAASMSRIAAAAGVSKPTLYSYFRDKEGLFVVLVQQLTQNTRKAIAHSANVRDFQTPPRKVLSQIASAMLEEFSQNQPLLSLIRLIIGESERFPEVAQTFIKEIEKPLLTQMSTYLDVHPDFHFKDPTVAARVFAGSLVHYLIIQDILRGDKLLPLERDRMANSLVDLILAASNTMK